MMPQPIGASEGGETPTKNAPTTPDPTTASTSVMQFMERYDQSGIKWKKWLQRLENAMEVSAISKTVKPKVLLHCIGAKAYDELTDLIAPAKPESMQYNELAEILTKHFEPEPLEMMELWTFRNRMQRDEESIKDYVQALLRKANDCGFGDHIQKAVRNQFVFGIRNEKTRLRLLQEKDLTLEKAKEIALGIEAVEKEEPNNVKAKAVGLEKKIDFPLTSMFQNYCNSPSAATFIHFINTMLKTVAEYYENNKGRESTVSAQFEINYKYICLTLQPKEDQPASSLRAITYGN